MKDLVNEYFNGTITQMTAEDFGNITYIKPFAFYALLGNNIDYTRLYSYVIPDTVKTIGASAFGYCRPSYIVIPDSVETIEEIAFFSNRTASTITIGASVSKIGNKAFSLDARSTALKTVTFRQPVGMTITLPTAGANGMFYCKKAYSVTIYTDNETIKNYDWASDNVTATFKHLDGSDWA